jgi:1-deoxy-D-xylulose-5-phosphate reductoisomerase
VFPAVRLAKEASAASGTGMAVYNAANEEAVHAFHEGRIGFPAIVETIAAVLEQHAPSGELTVESVLAAERWARKTARERLGML